MEKHMEIDDPKHDKNEGQEEKLSKTMVVIMVGAPGSGKSTFCAQVLDASSRSWVRICQDTINNGKSGTKVQCLKSAAAALKENKSIFIDRCNLDREQRAEFVKLGSPEVDVHAVVLDLPAKLCISRSIKRTGHESNLQGGKAAAVVNRMLQKKELPKLSEGFSRITICHSESDVEKAVTTYSTLRLYEKLPSGTFGQINADAKVQVGIMKFLKKVDNPMKLACSSSEPQNSLSRQSTPETPVSSGPKSTVSVGVRDEHKDGDCIKVESVRETTASMQVPDDIVSSGTVPTLAFPSISTADFKFDTEKASSIIVQKVEEYIKKLGNARLVLVDLSHQSRILSLVKAKAAEQNIDPKRFFTFVGDITSLCSKGGLQCNVIANATNWRLRPGGGGVNAAIFRAAGPSLEIATKERANSLAPGRAIVVPLPAVSPLLSTEGVTHVIHVLGPNMNSERPNCLNNYNEGCKILAQAYSSLFDGFLSILKTRTFTAEAGMEKTYLKRTDVQAQPDREEENDKICNQKIKGGDVNGEERSKKQKGLNFDRGYDEVELRKGMQLMEKSKADGSSSKAWGRWAQALYNIAMNPQMNDKDVLEMTADVVVINDGYPKAKKHILVLARLDGLDCLGDVSVQHLLLLKTMHKVGSVYEAITPPCHQSGL